jgi:hypothetical protein
MLTPHRFVLTPVAILFVAGVALAQTPVAGQTSQPSRSGRGREQGQPRGGGPTTGPNGRGSSFMAPADPAKLIFHEAWTRPMNVYWNLSGDGRMRLKTRNSGWKAAGFRLHRA